MATTTSPRRALRPAAYDVRMVMSSTQVPGSGLRLPRSTVLLIFGILVGIGIGFAYGLIKPGPGLISGCAGFDLGQPVRAAEPCARGALSGSRA